jgi:hypothetical protein
MSVTIEWPGPVVLEVRKQAKWERVIRFALGDIEDALEVSLSFQKKRLGWTVEAAAPQGGAHFAARSRARVANALRSAGMPAL